MNDTVVIPARFTGPPDSANGGYACGTVARLLANDAAGGAGPGQAMQATLRQPPPLDRPLDASVTGDGRAALHDGDVLVAEATLVDLPTDDTPAPIPLDGARAAAAAFDTESYAVTHPFPTCFTCGPQRDAEDGLRIFPGAVAPHVVAWPWAPHASLASADGLVDTVYVWAALDCPSGLCWYHDEPDAGPHVLGRMTAVLHRRPEPEEPLVVAGWTVASAGRKRLSGSVVWDAGGTVVADNRSTWIALDERTGATFRPANSPS